MPGEGYDAFAVIHDRAQLGTPASDKILDDYIDGVDVGYLYEPQKGKRPTIERCAAFMAHLEKVTSGPSGPAFF